MFNLARFLVLSGIKGDLLFFFFSFFFLFFFFFSEGFYFYAWVYIEILFGNCVKWKCLDNRTSNWRLLIISFLRNSIGIYLHCYYDNKYIGYYGKSVTVRRGNKHCTYSKLIWKPFEWKEEMKMKDSKKRKPNGMDKSTAVMPILLQSMFHICFRWRKLDKSFQRSRYDFCNDQTDPVQPNRFT